MIKTATRICAWEGCGKEFSAGKSKSKYCPECRPIARQKFLEMIAGKKDEKEERDMKIFEFSWTWYENYEPHLFYHPDSDNISQEKWEEDCKKALREAGEEYIENETSWVMAHRWIEAACEKLISPEFGYFKVKTTRYNIWGAYIIEGDSEDDAKFRQIVGSDLYQKAIKKNADVRKGQDERLGKWGQQQENS